jgi:hypothetical protein
MDLLSTVAHEMGHLLGLADLHGDEHASDLMGEALETGTRRVPTAELVTEGTDGIDVHGRIPATKPTRSFTVPVLGAESTAPADSTTPVIRSETITWFAPVGDMAEPARESFSQGQSFSGFGQPAAVVGEAEPRASVRNRSTEWPEMLRTSDDEPLETWWGVDLGEAI